VHLHQVIHQKHLTLVQVVKGLVILVVEVVVLLEMVDLHQQPTPVQMQSKEHNYLGRYLHGDGGNSILQDYQEHHQLLPIQQDLLVQEDNYLGDMDGLLVAVVVVEVFLVLATVVTDMLEVEQDQEKIHPMVDLQVLDLMDLVFGLLLVLVVVEEELVDLVILPFLVQQEEVLLVL
tara:strand:- start:90 stop:617 length:528 start_codon:yes stop_codon:yes gene_type:complete